MKTRREAGDEYHLSIKDNIKADDRLIRRGIANGTKRSEGAENNTRQNKRVRLNEIQN
jgi:hypothetical protein